MTTRQKLLAAFGLLAVLVLLTCLLGLRTAHLSNEAFSLYVHGSAARMELANQVMEATNERALAARNMLLADTPERLAAAKAAAMKAQADVQSQLGRLVQSAASAPDPQVRPLVAAMAAVEARYSPVAADILARAGHGDHEGAVKRMNAECVPLLAELLHAGQAFLDYGAQRGREEITRADDTYRTAMAGLVVAMVVAVGTALAMGLGMPRALMRALGAEPQVLGGAARRIAEGDLRAVQEESRPVAGSVLASMVAMRASLAGIVAQVRGGSDGVASASSQIARGNQDLSARTEQQASALQQTASAMEQLGATVRQNAEHAREADRLARCASSVAREGGDAVAEVVQQMKGIDESSRRIADIIAVIDGIAFQTNILALNAAVEAARAGEQGRGFAVVAGEVRSLARRSADAAHEIKRLITDSVERVAQGSELVDQAGRTMQEVVASIHRVSEIVGEISSASTEQSQGVAQVGQAVAQMDQATQQNAALVEQSAAAAASLQRQAQMLVEAVAVFRNAGPA